MSVLSPTGRLRDVTVDGQPLAVREWGEPDGTPLLFWHPLGTVTSGAWLTELAPMLTRTYGLRLVAPDAPGFGRSPAMAAEDMSVPRLAALAWGLADELGLELPVLMGHSWGGVVMTCAAATRPADVAALVLLDSGHVDYGDHPQSNAEQSLDDRAAEVETQLEVWADRAALHAEVAADVRRPVTDLLLAAVEPAVRARPDGALVPVVAARSLAGARHAMVRERSSTRWASLSDTGVPVLLLLADEPAEVREQNRAAAARMASVVPQLDARVMTGWGHDLIGDGGPDLAAEVGRWLAVSSRRR
jgi:pimeloyl-ACP methyl ester carboxylesterase